MIKYNCPNCGRLLQIPEKYAGTRGTCNYCGHMVKVPARGFPIEEGRTRAWYSKKLGVGIAVLASAIALSGLVYVYRRPLSLDGGAELGESASKLALSVGDTAVRKPGPVSPRPPVAVRKERRTVFYDDFDSGNANQWNLDSSWTVELHGGNFVLSGSTHQWAKLL